jgi:hypothetical protein
MTCTSSSESGHGDRFAACSLAALLLMHKECIRRIANANGAVISVGLFAARQIRDTNVAVELRFASQPWLIRIRLMVNSRPRSISSPFRQAAGGAGFQRSRRRRAQSPRARAKAPPPRSQRGLRPIARINHGQDGERGRSDDRRYRRAMPCRRRCRVRGGSNL